MVEPYAINGSRDVRTRAVQAVAEIEWVRTLVDQRLKACSTIGPLALYYYSQRDAFQWRLREHMRRSRSLTEADWEMIQRKCRPNTLRTLEQAKTLLAVRASAKGVLRLVEWALTYGETWREQTVTLRWAYGEDRRAIWGHLLSGGAIRRGMVREEDGRESGQLQVVESLMVKRPEQWRGEVTRGVEYAVEALAAIDRQLQEHKEQLTRFIRLYYHPKLDTWELRQITGPNKSQYLSEEIASCLAVKQPEVERQRVDQVVELIGQRKRVKRMLRLIATLAEAAAYWPGGRWQLRGEAAGRLAWTATTVKHGLTIVTNGRAVGYASTTPKEGEVVKAQCAERTLCLTPEGKEQ